MFCTHCGARRGEGDLFCHACGTAFPDAPPGAGPAEQRHRRPIATVLLISVVVLLLGSTAAGGVVLLTSHRSPTPATIAASPHPRIRTSTPTAPTLLPTPAPAAGPTPTEQTFTDLYKGVASGVVRIETTACDGGGVGSGFLIAPDLVATVAHVVAHSVSVVVRDGHTTTTGTVVGYNPDTELAVVRTSVPLPGHVFRLDVQQPDVGTDIGAIGYPLGGPESLSKGSVSGLGRGIDVEGHRLHQLIQTDASINPGNSGGPLLTVDGTVVGLVVAKRNDAANIGYAIPANLAAGQFQTWREAPRPVHWVNSCSAPTGPDGVPVDITDRSGHPDGAAIGHAFATYVNGINSGDYASAYAVLSPRDQQKVSYRDFSHGIVSSFIVDLSIGRITSAPGGDKVDVRFTSVQDPAYGVHGQDCSNWRLTYTMVQSAGRWLIDAAIPRPGSPTAC